MAGLEALGVAVLPIFMIAMTSRESLVKLPLPGILTSVLQRISSEHLIVWLGIGMIVFFILKNMLLVLFGYFQSRFIAVQQAALSTRLFSTYLHAPYLFHLHRNSAELIRNTTGSTFALFTGVVIPGATVITECMVVLLISALLLLSNPVPTLIAIISLSVFVLIFYHLFRIKVGDIGHTQHQHATEMIKWVSQGLGGIKESKVLGKENYFIDSFKSHILHYSISSTYLQLINQLPRYFIEVMVMIGIVIIVFLLQFQNANPELILPKLSLFAVAAIRLMPSISRILSGLTTVRYNLHLVESLNKDLSETPFWYSESERKRHSRLQLSKQIQLKDVTFFYPNTHEPVIRNLSIQIPKGSMVAFVGMSGSGKTTLVDIILGLYKPTEGHVYADGVDIHVHPEDWQGNIGYVPQTVYLSDDTLKRNVAFGLKDHEIVDGQVIQALQNAQLMDLVDDLPQGMDSVIGEHGSRLSGGQRQRIGIARALYHNPALLIMDEATSALDNRTENEISSVLQSLVNDKTIIIIAHRVNTIKRCQLLFLLEKGQLIASGSYQELLTNNLAFQTLMGMSAKSLIID